MNGLSEKGKSFLFAVLMILLIFVCAGCNDVSNAQEEDEVPKEGEIKIYCLNSSNDGLHWDNYELEEKELDDKIKKVFSLLGKNPEAASHKRALPEDVNIISYYFGKDGQLIIDFSSQYLNMEIIQEILVRAAIVKTFCQLDGVDYLEFYVEGVPLKQSEMPIGLMSASDFVDDNYGSEAGFKQNMTFTIYMTDSDGKIMHEASVEWPVDGTKTLEQAVLECLFAASENGSGLRTAVNSRTKINKVHSYDGVCYVDLSEAFLTKPSNVSDDVAVYSVVNTLCELPGIMKVRLTIDGNEKKSFGKVAINELLSLKPELILQEKAGESTGSN